MASPAGGGERGRSGPIGRRRRSPFESDANVMHKVATKIARFNE
jgi:hypothetical protein